MTPPSREDTVRAVELRDYPWAELPDEELLTWRISDLGLRLAASAVEPRIHQLYGELDERGLTFHPRCYITTEWLCPDRVPLIGVPFYLAHPRLHALEQTVMLEVEGGTPESCMQLLRHEMGHAINYAYLFYQRTRWRELFGPISQTYDVQEYYPRPYSRQYVEHLPDSYAQAHPDEDFAETFAVWLTPGLDWRQKYRGWPALKKLEYVDHLVSSIDGAAPRVTTGDRLWPVSRVRSKLATYYQRRKKDLADSHPSYYDRELRSLFAEAAPGPPDGLRATAFLRQHRQFLIREVAERCRVRKYAVDLVIRRLTQRSKELGLVVRGDPATSLTQLGIVLTALISEARHRELQFKLDQECDA